MLIFISTINPFSNEQLILNSPIQLIEMKRALSKCTSLAPGPDNIPYSFIHNLPNSVLDKIIKVFNKIWSTGSTPQNWKHSIIIPILKPGKNKFEINSYRPISLLNTMIKILEKIIDTRLRWFLEKNGFLDPRQNGFRRHRSKHLTRYSKRNNFYPCRETSYGSNSPGHFKSLRYHMAPSHS